MAEYIGAPTGSPELPYLIEITAQTAAALYYSTAVEIRKFEENREQRTENRQTDRQRIQLQRPLLSLVDRRGERANSKNYPNAGYFQDPAQRNSKQHKGININRTQVNNSCCHHNQKTKYEKGINNHTRSNNHNSKDNYKEQDNLRKKENIPQTMTHIT